MGSKSMDTMEILFTEVKQPQSLAIGETFTASDVKRTIVHTIISDVEKDNAARLLQLSFQLC